jgi:hypothetical protein
MSEGQGEKESFADALYRNQSERSRLEDVVFWFLKDKYENGIEDIKSYDWYDYSIEFWVTKGTVLDEGEQRVLWDLGFSRCWLCVRDGKKEDEVYYSSTLRKTAEVACEASP